MGFHFYYHGNEVGFSSKWMDDDALEAHAEKLCEENDIPYVVVRFGFTILGAYGKGVRA